MTAAKRPTIFTVGHSNHTMEEFVSLLREHCVDVVVDIRSSPYSGYADQFNRDAIREALRELGIRYEFLGGGMLGGRPTDRSFYDNDRRVCYDEIAKSDGFRASIEYLVRGANKCRIALMCAEMEPLDCHRTLLVTPVLVKCKINVVHILADGNLENHDAAMDRLVESFPQPLFGPPTREEAISLQAKEVGYVFKDPLASEEYWSKSS